MDAQKLDMYLISNSKYFPPDKIMYIRERLSQMDENNFINIATLELKDPSTLLLISIFLGGLGIDRFMLGDIPMGILKLLTGGLCGVLTIYDWFIVSNKTKEINFQNFMMRV